MAAITSQTLQYWCWRLILAAPLVIGFLAVWRLIPQARTRGADIQAGFALIALVLAGAVWIKPTGSQVYDILFAVFAFTAVGAAGSMIAQSNPVYAALWFAVSVLGVCGLYLLQSAPFLAAATIIVYAGAIIVTFLFVIMLAQQHGRAIYDSNSNQPWLATLAGFVMFAVLYVTLNRAYGVSVAREDLMKVQADSDVIASMVRYLDLTANGKPAESLLTGDDRVCFDLWKGTDGSEQASCDCMARQLDRMAPTLQAVVAAIPDKTQRRTLQQRLESFGDIKRIPSGSRAASREGLQALRLLQADLFSAWVRQTPEIAARLPSGVAEKSTSQVVGAENFGQVRGLGRSLLGDYLWGIEIAGTLLTLAVVGAIAIAPRSSQGAI